MYIFNNFIPAIVFALIIFVLFLILSRFLSNVHKKKKGIIMSIVFGILTFVFLFAYIYDKFINTTALIIYESYLYFILIGTSFLVFLYGLFLIIKFRKINFAIKQKKKMVYTYNRKDEYVYIIYKFNDKVYLLKDTNSGIKYKLKNNEFSDEIVNKLNSQFSFYTEKNIEKNGIVRVKGEKVDDIYYCYLINFITDVYDQKFNVYSLLEVSNLNMDDIDRFIIYNNLMNSNFDIEF